MRNTQRYNAQRREKYLKDKDKILAYNNEWRKKNPEKMYRLSKKWRANNLEKARLHSRRYKERNKDKVKEAGKIYREKYKNKISQKNKIHNAKKDVAERRHIVTKQYYDNHKVIVSERSKKRREASKLIVLNHYGEVCSCCGLDNIMGLTVDHINGNGAKHRGEIGNGSIYIWLIKNNFPKGFRILCFTCNSISYYNKGICNCKDKDYKYEKRLEKNEYVHKILSTMPSLLQDDKKI